MRRSVLITLSGRIAFSYTKISQINFEQMDFGEGGGAPSSNSPTPRPVDGLPKTSSSSASSSAQYLPYYSHASFHLNTSLPINPATTMPLDSLSPFRSSFNDLIYSATPSLSATHVANARYSHSSTLTRPVTPPPQSLSFSCEATMIDVDDQNTAMVLLASQVPLPNSPSRPLRVSMGPRTGCEKCRLKIPGHWMHVAE